MTCPKCKSEQTDGSKFCSQCAAPLASADEKSKARYPTWVIILVTLGVAYLGFAAWNVFQDDERAKANIRKTALVNAAEPLPQPHSVKLTNGAATVNATGYSWYKFEVPTNVSQVVIAGHFTA